MDQQKQTIYIDASALKESNCDRRLLNTIFFGYSPRGMSHKYSNYKAGYGSAFHKALEYWYGTPKDQRSITTAVELAFNFYTPYTPFIKESPLEYRTITHLTQAVEAYFTYHQYGDLIERLSVKSLLPESKFIIPMYEDENFKLILTGTIDLIGLYMGEETFIDHKSTAAYGSKDEYFKDYDLSVQMMVYSWVLDKLIGKRLPCIINGIFLKKPTAKATSFDGVSFARSNRIWYSDQQMKEFEWWLLAKIELVKNFIKAYHSLEKNLEPNYNPAACMGKFGRCQYFSLCSLSPELRSDLLATMDRVPYEPLKFGEA